jgi:RNA polymerase sigma-70 factor (ECF subfamily)
VVSRRDAPDGVERTGRSADSGETTKPTKLGYADGGRTLTDEHLAQRMFAGDEKATRQLLERYRRPLYATLLRLTRNPADADELFQETFVRALGAGSRFDASRRFKPWIFTIATNLARDRAKRAAHFATPELRAPEELPQDERRAVEHQWNLQVDLSRALDQLSEPHRSVIELRYFEGLEESEIARSADIPRGTVKSRLHHALRKLRDLMTPRQTT